MPLIRLASKKVTRGYLYEIPKKWHWLFKL